MRRDVPLATRPKPPATDGLWVLELPFVKPLSLNDRAIWQVRAGQVKPWRQAVALLARVAHIPACRRIDVQLHYTPKDDRTRDPLNLGIRRSRVSDGRDLRPGM